ncbi:MAG: M20 metallopeptidase family protein [Bacteroidota bacterium]
MELIERVKALSKDYFEDVVFFRRHFHAAPELSMQEHKTAAFIASRLEEMGIPFEEGIAETGLVATIEGKKPASAMVALRADMDALPILEQNNVEYKSANPGVMHACGHDVHMAGMLGTARILHTLRDQWEGTVKILFQPSEENYPGGASLMLQAGIFEDQRPDAMFGQHVYPGLPVGKVGIRSGRYMASTDEVYITVKGKGGHAATPHLIIDPVVIASHIVIALQQIVSRHASPTVPTVLSFGKIMGEGLTNVIPDEVKLEGTFRTFDEEWREKAHLHIREVAVFVAQGMGAECDVFIDKGYPFLINHEKTTAHFQAYASEYLGQENVEELDLSMTAEDFAYYSQRFPTCFYRLGTRNVEQGITSNQHTATFDVDEKALETGMGLMAWAAMQELKHKQG